MSIKSNYSDGFFDVSATHGFLPIKAPLVRLPTVYNDLQEVLDKMPVVLNENEFGFLHTIDGIVAPVMAIKNHLEDVEKEQDIFILQALFRSYSFLCSAYLLEPSYQQFKKDGKYGYISAKDSIILKAEYDEIKQNDSENMYFENNFKILKKGDKYGAIVGYGKNKVIVEPKFPKKPAYYINDYQGIKGKILFGLTEEGTEEENGEFFCYGDESGNVFYREGK
jgi:hypothetical protein